MNILVETLGIPQYSHPNLVGNIVIDPSDIKKAMIAGSVEERSFQRDFEAIRAQWDKARDVDELREMVKTFHVDRIATLITNRTWEEPIICYMDRREVVDGGHRIWAARFLGRSVIDALVLEDRSSLSDEEKERLWKKTSDFGGNVEHALICMDVKYRR